MFQPHIWKTILIFVKMEDDLNILKIKIKMTAKTQSARAGRLPWAPAWQDTMPAATPPTPGTASLPGKQPFTATTTMPDQAGAVA